MHRSTDLNTSISLIILISIIHYIYSFSSFIDILNIKWRNKMLLFRIPLTKTLADLSLLHSFSASPLPIMVFASIKLQRSARKYFFNIMVQYRFSQSWLEFWLEFCQLEEELEHYLLLFLWDMFQVESM